MTQKKKLSKEQQQKMLRLAELTIQMRELGKEEKALKEELALADLLDGMGTEAGGSSNVLMLGDYRFMRTEKQGKPTLDPDKALAMVQKKYPKLSSTLIQMVPQLDENALAEAVQQKKVAAADFEKCVTPGKSSVAVTIKLKAEGDAGTPGGF